MLLTDLLRDCCSGWLIKYELWRLENEPKRWLDLQVPLDEAEVWLQMYHSVWSPWGAAQWVVQFPVAISPDLRIISVLRTVYDLRNISETMNSTLPVPKRFKLDFSCLPNLARIWERTIPPPETAATCILTTRKDYLYLYRLKFSTCNSYLLFLDYKRAGHEI